MEQPQIIVQIVSLVLSVIITIVWVIRRRGKAKKKEVDNINRGRYTISQFIGMAAIVVFILPILVSACWTIAQVVMLFGVFLIAFIPLSEPIEIVVWGLILVPSLTIAFIVLYYACEMIWPKRSLK